MTPAQCAAARKALDWTAHHLATQAGVSTQTILNFERGRSRTNRLIVASIQKVLTEAGVEFVPAPGEAVPGARVVRVELEDGSAVVVRVGSLS